MKKGLSVLLIAAALFGFYGGAVNLNDVLACKDYWEEEDEKSTADLNKLEDGLNQLKDNEEAYLDGLKKVADGEEALAQGEADYAEGQATLAKGEADYAAAPGKLADARKKIAQGEDDLAAGEAKLAAGYAEYNQGKKDYAAAPAKLAAGEEAKSNLDKLISGLNKVKTLYETQWRPGFDSKPKDASTGEGAGLKQAKGIISSLVTSDAMKEKLTLVATFATTDYDSMVQPVKDAKDSYSEFDKAMQGLSSDFSNASDAVQTLKDQVDAAASSSDLSAAAQGLDAYSDLTGSAIDAAIENLDPEAADYQQKATLYNTLKGTRAAVKSTADGYASKFGGSLPMVGKLDSNLADSLQSNLGVLTGIDGSTTNGDIASAIQGLAADLGKLSEILKANKAEIDGYKSKFDDWHTGYDSLVNGQAQMADAKEGLPYAFGQMVSNPTIKSALEDNAKSLIAPLKLYSTARLATDNLDAFETDMDIICSKVIPPALKVLQGIKAAAVKQLNDGYADYEAAPGKLAAAEKQLAQGEKDLAAGKKKLADGKAQYAQGLADYKAAPAKLAAGRAALQEGLQKLMDGRAELAEGKDKLAEYEDGEQQVRDGLATLMASEANGGLESILERRNGDDDFDNGGTHLDLDEGLDAVKVGWGYKGDSGVLVTKEITNRAIGTAAGLGAAALAVLAGILSLLKKNKGAGVLALLSAVAGGAGIAYGTSKGMEFSNIAGSTIGALPWVAFGVLAAVAVVHAIAHFASKEA